MSDLAERISAAIDDPNTDLWFPELTPDLAAMAWNNLRDDVGLTPGSYSTARVLARSLSAPRDIVTYLRIHSLAGDEIAIETLPEQHISKYRKAGVSFYSPQGILNTTIPTCLEDALLVINHVPSLIGTVTALVRSLHVIKPEDEDHDVSFSEPHVPFSIFVSVPEKRIANDALRVAEAIVHEAMHLQLTLIEENVALSVATRKQFFSPWRGEYRTTPGVLHGLYVFRVIDEFLRTLIPIHEPAPANLSYIKNRLAEISQQVRTIQDFKECSHLTKLGSALARILTEIEVNTLRGLSSINLRNQRSQQQNGDS